jgi:hypothetical protein
MSLTLKRLRQVLDYNPETGIFTRKLRGRRGQHRLVAGGKHSKGYITIGIDCKSYLAHQLAWFYVYGKWIPQIDHENRIKTDNWIENLRPATTPENLHNAKRPRHNTSGLKGASFSVPHRKWRSYIQVRGKHMHLGLFQTREEAHAAYVNAARQHFGEFANAGETP